MSQQPGIPNPTSWQSNLGDKYETYIDFLEAIRGRWPEYEALYLYLKAVANIDRDIFAIPRSKTIDIVDIESNNTVTAPERIWDFHDGNYGIGGEGVNKIKEDCKVCRMKIAQRPPDVKFRFLLVQDAMLDQYQVDSLGLTCRIAPWALWIVVRSAWDWDMWWTIYLQRRVPSETYSLFNHVPPARHPSLLRMGQLYVLYVDDETAVIIFDGQRISPKIISSSSNGKRLYEISHAEIRATLSQAPSFDTHDVQLNSSDAIINGYMRLRNFAAFFAESLLRNRTENQRPLLSCLQALTQLYTARTQWIVSASTRMARRTTTAGGYQADLRVLWNIIRFQMEEIRTTTRTFKKFANQHLATSEESSRKVIGSLVEQLQEASTELVEVVDLVRELLDMEVANKAIQESQKTIEMAELSIMESKRVKLLTILAFVFVPLSLATSMFGMNLQELNESGKHLWVFFVTAAALYAVTMSFWTLAYLFTRARQNWKSDKLYRGKDSVRSRLLVAIRLTQQGHLGWMVWSGTLLGLLTDGRYGYYTKLNELDRGVGPLNMLQSHVESCQGKINDGEQPCELLGLLPCGLPRAKWLGWKGFCQELSYLFGLRSFSDKDQNHLEFYEAHTYARQ